MRLKQTNHRSGIASRNRPSPAAVERTSGDTASPKFACVANDVRLGPGVRLAPFVNLYGCEIGADTRLGAFVEIQRDVLVGRQCKISSHTFICSGVVIEDEVFIGHGVIFINDRDPRATNSDGTPKQESDWRMEQTFVRRGASIGSGCTILCGIEIGERARVGAGAVVTRDVPAEAVVAGNPARPLRVESAC
jgi:acetyltransferase-like isoleucine patch superfamily enzyme